MWEKIKTGAKAVVGFIQQFPSLIWLLAITVLGVLFTQEKRKADTLQRANELKDSEKNIAVKEEELKHEEKQANEDVESYRDAKSKYDKLRGNK